MKLHLGCGENYLSGYVNIDFPKQYHSVQQKRVADIYADILALKYPRESVEEIRLHHVFEHFPRATACALLVCWREWLIHGGYLRVELPDFPRTALAVLNPLSTLRSRNVALRHVFGSQEARWATHYEGWSISNLKYLLAKLHYRVIRVSHHMYKGTFSFDLTARKLIKVISRSEYEKVIREYLSTYCLDNSETEQKILSVWMENYRLQVKKNWPR